MSGHHHDPAGPGRHGHGDRSAALALTVSDGVAAGTREDRSGAVIADRLRTLGFEVGTRVVADEPDQIAAILVEAADAGTRLVVSSGGTGVGPRDRTPEAVMRVADYVVPGFGERMRAEGRRRTPLASLSRSLGAVRGAMLVLCLPGSPGGAADSLDAVADLIGHTLDTLAGRTADSPAEDPHGP